MKDLSNLPPGVSVFDEHINPSDKIDIDQTVIETWFERDRAHVLLSIESPDYAGEHGETILEFWDDAVSEAVEDGFLDPRDWHQSAYNYAKHLGLV